MSDLPNITNIFSQPPDIQSLKRYVIDQNLQADLSYVHKLQTESLEAAIWCGKLRTGSTLQVMYRTIEKKGTNKVEG